MKLSTVRNSETSVSRKLILNDNIKAICLYSILFPTQISGTNCFLLAYARSLSLDAGVAGVIQDTATFSMEQRTATIIGLV